MSTGPFDPFDDSAAPAVQVRQLSGHASRMRPLGWLELLAAVLAIGVVLSFAGLTRGRGRGLGNAGVLLGTLGAAGMCLVAVRHWLFGALAGVPRATAVGVLDRLDHVAGPAVLPLLVTMPGALLLLAAAGWRAGFVPRRRSASWCRGCRAAS